MLWIEPARQAHRAQDVGAETVTERAKRVLDEAVVEPRVVGNEQVAVEPRAHLPGQRGEGRRVAYHGIGDAGQRLDLGRD
jgi:hypothetical protein